MPAGLPGKIRWQGPHQFSGLQCCPALAIYHGGDVGYERVKETVCWPLTEQYGWDAPSDRLQHDRSMALGMLLVLGLRLPISGKMPIT